MIQWYIYHHMRVDNQPATWLWGRNSLTQPDKATGGISRKAFTDIHGCSFFINHSVHSVSDKASEWRCLPCTYCLYPNHSEVDLSGFIICQTVMSFMTEACRSTLLMGLWLCPHCRWPLCPHMLLSAWRPSSQTSIRQQHITGNNVILSLFCRLTRTLRKTWCKAWSSTDSPVQRETRPLKRILTPCRTW